MVDERWTTFVEDLGEFFCQVGEGRIAGRLVAVLLICDPPLQSAADLAEATGASKGSISTLLRKLVDAGLIERKGVAGKRQTFYRIKPGAWWQILSRQIQVMGQIRKIADTALQLMDKEPPEHLARLREMRDFSAFAQERLPTLLLEWHDMQRAKASAEGE